jgi:catechol 2,3-dioxygenase-like lactoylglutathione lyase family enzyme
MRIVRAELEAPGDLLDALAGFYGKLGLAVERTAGRVALSAGADELAFAAAAGDARPFYHFALLVPGGRFAPALAWAREHVQILPGGEDGVFDFEFWDALACYFHDPAGNIVELIAHADRPGEATGAFEPAELLGLSEVGIVSRDPVATVRALERELGLECWSGGPGDGSGLSFVGGKARTLIVSPLGRGWLPTGRPAEVHGVRVLLEGGTGGTLELPEAGAVASSAPCASTT